MRGQIDPLRVGGATAGISRSQNPSFVASNAN